MASIIPGFEYDIFVSYRQNDNKYDGWVTSFVTNLSIELEATIKEKVSVYFDINPHDGLLETHTVDRSLEEKLKCLIFIPILSKTYCDKNSFAWQNEFCAFNKLALQDKLGRDIRLGRGNFASRILPVKIHELNPEDVILLENELGGSLRSIDFVFLSAGVNRPLRANEDHPYDNLNKTYYRDQINKVANAVAEIIMTLKKESELSAGIQPDSESDDLHEAGRVDDKSNQKKQPYTTGSWILFTGIVLLGILSLVYKLIYPDGFTSSARIGLAEKSDRISITVMPFRNLTNDTTLNYLSIGVQEGIITALSYYPEEFIVRPFEIIRTALIKENMRDLSSISPVTGSRISKRLDAEYFLLGDIFKTSGLIRLNTQLIRTDTEEIIKSFQSEGISEEVMFTIDKLSDMVRNYLLLAKIDEEAIQADTKYPHGPYYNTGSAEAYRYHILSRQALLNLDYKTALKMDSQAVAIDSNFVGALVSLSWEYYYTGNFDAATKWLQKAYLKRDKLPLVQQIGLDYQYACLFQTPIEEIKYLKQLQKIEDNNPNYYLLLGYLYVYQADYEEAITELEKAYVIFKNLGTEPNDLFYFHFLLTAYNKTGQHRKVKETLRKAEKFFNKNPGETNKGDRFYKMALIYSDAGMYEQAEENFKKGLNLNPGNTGIISTYAFSLINNDLDINRGLDLIDNALQKDTANAILIDIKGWALYRQKKYDEALKLFEKAYKLIPSNDIKTHIDSANRAISTKK